MTALEQRAGRIPEAVREGDRWEWAKFLEYAGRGEVYLAHCEKCEAVRLPTMPICRSCGGDEFDIRLASGRALVVSKTLVERQFGSGAPSVPYTTGVLQLEEGPRILGLLKGMAEPAIGDAVELMATSQSCPTFQPHPEKDTT